ncbi:MAG: HAMP domain-containing protein [Leptolyngbyaceae cyanobacterium CRU_2_3]|nr:HAMP domain-containing protein [Leptolyngbyaceae cyanobacterium CRU_2_3]
MKRCWRHLNLSQRIVLPFLAVCLSVFILAIFVLGYWFTSVLEQNIRTEVEVFAERAEQDFRYMQKIIKTQVDLVGNQDALRQAIERRDKIALLQVLLPLKAVLGFDWVKVVDPAGNILVDVRKDGLNQAQIFDVAISNSARFGADFTDFVGVKWDGKPAVLLVASQPIKKQRLLGGLIVGRLVEDALLQTIAAGSSKQLLALVNQQVIATTVSQAASVTLQAPDAQNSTQQMVLADQQYFVKSFGVRGSSAAFSVLVLYPIALLNITKQTLWLQLGLLFLLGGTIVTVVGNRIAQAIARPILRLTSITQQLADGDATVRVTSTSNDEVGQLGRAFNQMAEQMAERGLLNQQIHQLQQTLDELEKNQDQLIHTEKMSSLGQLVAGIAHEVNTPLGAIRASISNVNSSLEQALKELPPLLQALSPEHLNHFFTLLDWAQQPKEQLSSREERQLKRTLKQTLAALEISHLDAWQIS